MKHITIAALSLLMASAAVPQAHSQDPMSAPPATRPAGQVAARPDAATPDDAPTEVRPLLAGPRVEPGAMGDAATNFGGRRRPAPPVPLNRWRRALASLDFTPDQRREMAEAVQAFITAQQAFERTYGEEFRSLRQEIRSHREAGRDVPLLTLQRFGQIESEAPNILTMQRQVWGALSAEQQSQLRSVLAAPARRQNDAPPMDSPPPPPSSPID